MRTKIDILDPFLEHAKKFAAQRGQNLADVVNDALTEKLGREENPVLNRHPLQLITYGGEGTQPGIDLLSNAGVQSALDDHPRRNNTANVDVDQLR